MNEARLLIVRQRTLSHRLLAFALGARSGFGPALLVSVSDGAWYFNDVQQEGGQQSMFWIIYYLHRQLS